MWIVTNVKCLVFPPATWFGTFQSFAGLAHTLWMAARYLRHKNHKFLGVLVLFIRVCALDFRNFTAPPLTGFCCGWWGSVNSSLIMRSRWMSVISPDFSLLALSRRRVWGVPLLLEKILVCAREFWFCFHSMNINEFGCVSIEGLTAPMSFNGACGWELGVCGYHFIQPWSS